MRNQDFALYKKELDSLRKANYAYSKELLAFAKKNPDADIEHVILSSCLLIQDAEKFYGDTLPIKKARANASKVSKPASLHPLDAWAEYEQKLNSVLELDGKNLQTIQSFDGKNISIEILNKQPAIAEELDNVESVSETVTAVTVDDSQDAINVAIVDEQVDDVSLVYVVHENPLEAVSDEAEQVDNIDSEYTEAFAYDEVKFEDGNTSENDEKIPTVHTVESKGFSLHTKEYVAPEELTVDNSLVEEEKQSVVEPEVNVHTVTSKGFDLKTKEYVAPEELTVDNSINVQNVIDIENSEKVTGSNTELSDETNITIHDKEYAAPEELTVDNSINVQNIIITPSRPKRPKRKMFEKKAKPVDYSGVTSDDEQATEYTRKDNLDLFKVENETTSSVKHEEEKPKTVQVDERTLAEANEYVVGSDTDLTLKSKEYSAPEELTIDNSLPEASNVVGSDSANAIYVETLDNVIESNTEIKIKSKAYQAPEELTVDNSIAEEDSKPVEKKRGLFGRKRKTEPEAKVQPVVFLPPKPAEFDMPEATEGFVYKRKGSSTDLFVESEFIKSYKEERTAEPEVKSEATEEFNLEEDSIVDIIPVSTVQDSGEVVIDFNELAAEIAKEKIAKEQVVYARDKHLSKVKEDAENETTEVEEVEEDYYLEKQRLNKVSNSGFDASSIIKDIKIIDI